MTTPNPMALVQRGTSLFLEANKLPELKEHQVYVQVQFAAFNPTDRLAFDLNAFGDGAILGCDFAGVVTKIHPSVTRLAVGDRVAALVWGGEIEGIGAYSTISIADERLSFKIPNNLGYDEACSMPLAVNTAWIALFSNNCLALRSHASSMTPHLLVWGGSSTVGWFAIQLAKMHGIVVSTTCSPKNFKQAREAGATNVFDYHDEAITSNLEAVLPGVTHVFDTIGNPGSSATAVQAFGSRSGIMCTVRPGKTNTENVPPRIKITDVFVFTAFPWPHSYRGIFHWPTDEENHQLSKELYDQLPNLIEAGHIRPPPITMLGELSVDTVTQAMSMNRSNQVSGQKLCFKVNSIG